MARRAGPREMASAFSSRGRYRVASRSRSVVVRRVRVSRAYFPACSAVAFAISVCHCPDATHERGEVGRREIARAGAPRIDRPWFSAAELSTRRHFVPGPTSPAAIFAFHVSALRLSSVSNLLAVRGGRRRLASPQNDSAPRPPLAFFSHVPVSRRARYAIGKNYLSTICFVPFVRVLARTRRHSTLPDVTRSRAPDNNINRLRNRTRAQAEERLFLFFLFFFFFSFARSVLATASYYVSGNPLHLPSLAFPTTSRAV